MFQDNFDEGVLSSSWEWLDPKDDYTLTFARPGWLEIRAMSGNDLQPYYQLIHKLVGLHSPFQYDGNVWDGFGLSPPAFDTESLQYSAFQFGKVLLFGEYYKNFLKNAPNINVYLHANATNIQTNDTANHIEHVDVRTLTGQEYRVRARCFVLASGGIENPRLLLLSNTVNPKGLCNGNDLVGRFFMEHPTVSAGIIIAEDWQKLLDVFSPGLIGGRLVEIGLALSPQLQASKECLNAVTRAKVVVTQDSTQALTEMLWNLKHRRMPHQLNWYYGNKWLAQRLATVLRDPVGIVANTYRHLMGKPKRFNVDSVYLEIRTEQEPNPDSRVTLSDTMDGLGLQRAHLHWTLTERDKFTMKVAAEVFDREIKRLGLGELRMDSWLSAEDLSWSPDMVGGHHHMGTTRMSDSADSGIVDSTCRAHTVDNLYIAGSSVFSTSSYVNPTLTILALALRLADLLKAKLI